MPCVKQSDIPANATIYGGPFSSADECADSNCPACTGIVSNLSIGPAGWGRSVDACGSISDVHKLVLTNPISLPMLLTASGIVNDDVIINGSIYQPNEYAIDWDGCTRCPGGSNNGPHSWKYIKVLQPGESVTFGARDNGRCPSDPIDATLHVDWRMDACITSQCYRFTEWYNGPGDPSPGACCGGGGGERVITGPSWANTVKITGTYGDQLEFSLAGQRCYGFMIPPGINCEKGVKEINLTLSKGTFPYDSDTFGLRWIYNGGTTIGYDIDICFSYRP